MKNNLMQIIHVIVYERIHYDFPQSINKVCLGMLNYDNSCKDYRILCDNCPLHLAAPRKTGFNYIKIAVRDLQSTHG